MNVHALGTDAKFATADKAQKLFVESNHQENTSFASFSKQKFETTDFMKTPLSNLNWAYAIQIYLPADRNGVRVHFVLNRNYHEQ